MKAAGFTVFAGCRNAESEGAKKLKDLGIHVLQMDVTNQEQVDEAKRYVEDHLPSNQGLWALVNNAGQGGAGYIESHPMEFYEKLAATNLFGTIRVTKAFAPLVRRNGKEGSRIIQTSSFLSRVTVPGVGAYNVTKFGMKGFNDILRLEMKPFGVKVINVMPGNFTAATNVVQDGPELAIITWNGADESFRQDYGLEKRDRMHSWLTFFHKLSVTTYNL